MNTVISVKIDKELKEAVQAVAKSAGIPLSTLINAYLKQVVATRRIELYAPEPMTPKLEGLIAEVESEIEKGYISPAYSNASDFVKALKKK